ncbi:cell division protein FtsQ [Thalassovita taeanensis]|uniref:Cell division protein FtsQ n=2 Tax=Thalassovita taeanensis TaxID=657014 RepID=A0A1H9FGQ5_9RHOB|nr:cell division protein FtsQ/DivIB [Thalassovita taeanensis]SEQ37104.1 cell division protein FtsQ [Thalassovita taeanensis]
MRPDPAPSRWAYRMQRLMLTPLYRIGLRVGLPFVVALAAGTIWLSDQDRFDALRLSLVDLRNQVEQRPEFMVKLMAIDGAGPQIAEDIREIVPIDFPVSSFDLELDHIRTTIAELPAVADVSVRVRPGGVLQVDVKERKPIVLWRGHDGLSLLDENGFFVGQIAHREDHRDLPLIAGDGADQAVPQAMALIRAAGPLTPRLRGVVRMGNRRWDMVLDRGQRILLPEANPVQALERVIALHQAQDMMTRDLAQVDMRLPSRPTIRMSASAVDQWWRINDIGIGD